MCCFFSEFQNSISCRFQSSSKVPANGLRALCKKSSQNQRKQLRMISGALPPKCPLIRQATAHTTRRQNYLLNVARYPKPYAQTRHPSRKKTRSPAAARPPRPQRRTPSTGSRRPALRSSSTRSTTTGPTGTTPVKSRGKSGPRTHCTPDDWPGWPRRA